MQPNAGNQTYYILLTVRATVYIARERTPSRKYLFTGYGTVNFFIWFTQYFTVLITVANTPTNEKLEGYDTVYRTGHNYLHPTAAQFAAYCTQYGTVLK